MTVGFSILRGPLTTVHPSMRCRCAICSGFDPVHPHSLYLVWTGRLRGQTGLAPSLPYSPSLLLRGQHRRLIANFKYRRIGCHAVWFLRYCFVLEASQCLYLRTAPSVVSIQNLYQRYESWLCCYLTRPLGIACMWAKTFCPQVKLTWILGMHYDQPIEHITL